MSIKAGELFAELGIKGSEKTLSALLATKKGLSDAGSMALETKVAILAAVYAFERLMSESGKTGTGLTNFTAAVGTSAKALQQYEYAARQMGVANEETAASFQSLQAAMTKTLMGEGAPKGLGRVAMLTGGISPQDIDEFAKSPEKLMNRLQQYALSEKNKGLRNEVLKSFGLGDGTIAALSRNAFGPGALSKAPIYGDKELAALDKANIAWSNLGTKIEMAFGHFNAKHGNQLVNDITKITTAVIKLAEALLKVSERYKVFDAIGKAAGFIADAIESKPGTALGETHLEKKLFNWMFAQAPEDALSKALHTNVKPIWDSSYYNKGGGGSTTFQQNFHFQHDGKEHDKTAEAAKKGVQQAYRQRSAQGQVN